MNRQDQLKLANAVIGCHQDRDHHCWHCEETWNGEFPDFSIKHKDDCPVTLAKKVVVTDSYDPLNGYKRLDDEKPKCDGVYVVKYTPPDTGVVVTNWDWEGYGLCVYSGGLFAADSVEYWKPLDRIEVPTN